MGDFQEILNKYLAAKGAEYIPGVAMLSANRNGEIIADHSGGIDSLSKQPSEPFTRDTITEIHSMTKLLTSISALQCVERGLLSLDDDIAVHFPEWKDAMVFEGWNGDEPILRKAEKRVTLRHLLSHTSGLNYPSPGSNLQKWVVYKGLRKGECNFMVVPLDFEPGTQWRYGVSTDWAGRLVEKVSGMSLNEWMKANIFKPLEMKTTSFRHGEVATFKNPKASLTMLSPDGKASPCPSLFEGISTPYDRGGGGLFSTASDYIKVLISILRSDGKLLQPSTIETMFVPQIEDSSSLTAEMNESKRGISSSVENFSQKTGVGFALAGALTLDPIPGRREQNTLEWGGMANLFWWIDRVSGICGCQFEQLLPFGHPASIDLVREFEEHVYALSKASS